MHYNLLQIAEQHKTSTSNSFSEVFWQEQIKNVNAAPNGRRWHPLIIKFCLYIHHLSSSAYDILRKSGCLALPSGRTLRDYTHFIDNKPGFNADVDKYMFEQIDVKNLKNHEVYVGVIADEMKIKEGLIFNKSSGNILGFTNLGDVNQSIDLLEKQLLGEEIESPNELATSVFVIMVRGLIVDFNFPYASFPTHKLTGDQIMPLLMEATFRLERMGLKVLTHTLDGCSNNRKYFKLASTTETLPYKMQNPFTSESRCIYFLSDPPHLLKTTRNCFYNPRRRLEVNYLQ